MCGIFGYFNLNDSEVFYDIGKYSETREVKRPDI